MIKRIAVCFIGFACAGALHAQENRRLPVIAGSMGVNYIVEVDGTVRGWGGTTPESTFFGDGSENAEHKEPFTIPGLTGIVDVATGMGHTLMVTRDGRVLAWGRNNGCELAVKDDRKRLTPIVVEGITNAVQVAASEVFSAALLSDGTVRVWGSNQSGLLANGQSGYKADCAIKPVPVEGLSGVKKIVVDSSMLALKRDGTVWGWGPNKFGELCDGTTEPRTRPVQMKGIANAVDIDTSGNSAIVLADGSVWMCGVNNNAALSTAPKGSKHATPYRIPGVANAVAVRMAGTTLVRLKDGTLLGWGYGMHGSLGDGYVDRVWPQPHPPVGLGPVLAHFYASNEGYAIRADGTVMGWGFFTGGRKEWALTPVARFKAKLAE